MLNALKLELKIMCFLGSGDQLGTEYNIYVILTILSCKERGRGLSHQIQYQSQ